MEKIYSKVEPGKLLHFVVRLSDIENQEGFRNDLVDPNEFIQCSSLKMETGHTFKPHFHNFRQRYWKVIAQESWVVIKGSVKCIFYDLDQKTIIAEPILYPGDSSFSLGEAGHNYLVLEPSIVLEYKTGKYESREIDKTFI